MITPKRYRHFLWILALGLIVTSSPVFSWAAQGAQRVTMSYTAVSLTWLPLKVAVDRGFFAEEGIEPNLVLMRGNLATVALSSGDIDFALNITTALQGTLQGLGLKLVAALNTRPLFSLVVRPGIKTAA